MKILKWFLGIIALLVIIFLLGPKPNYETISAAIPNLNLELSELPVFIKKNDAKMQDMRESNASSIIWADSVRQTDYVLLYLHGFSASPVEGYPTHKAIARRYGMNFYAPLLAGHGSASKESFLTVTPQDWIEDAGEALAIAGLLGKQIIVMSCSTGSTLAVYMAAKFPELIAAHVMYSPNFELADGSSKILSMPWGLKLAKMVIGSDYRSFKISKEASPYWTSTYRVEGLQALRYLLDDTMTDEIWSAFDDPYLIAYYYKNEEAKDDVISIDAIQEFHKSNATSKEARRLAPLAEPKSHIIACSYQSQNIEVVEKVTIDFLDQFLTAVSSENYN